MKIMIKFLIVLFLCLLSYFVFKIATIEYLSLKYNTTVLSSQNILHTDQTLQKNEIQFGKVISFKNNIFQILYNVTTPIPGASCTKCVIIDVEKDSLGEIDSGYIEGTTEHMGSFYKLLFYPYCR